MDFGDALHALKRGAKVTRSGWNGRGQHLELQRPDELSKMTLPYIFITTVQGDRVPWLASQSDMLANDWCFVEEPEEAESLAMTLARAGELFSVLGKNISATGVNDVYRTAAADMAEKMRRWAGQ